jgi:hypothetical protein
MTRPISPWRVRVQVFHRAIILPLGVQRRPGGLDSLQQTDWERSPGRWRAERFLQTRPVKAIEQLLHERFSPRHSAYQLRGNTWQRVHGRRAIRVR